MQNVVEGSVVDEQELLVQTGHYSGRVRKGALLEMIGLFADHPQQLRQQVISLWTGCFWKGLGISMGTHSRVCHPFGGTRVGMLKVLLESQTRWQVLEFSGRNRIRNPTFLVDSECIGKVWFCTVQYRTTPCSTD